MKIRSLRWRFYKKKGGGRIYSLRCKEFEKGCIVCQAWKFLDDNKRFPSVDEALSITTSVTIDETRSPE